MFINYYKSIILKMSFCVLSNNDILEELNNNVIIKPFETKHLSNCSYDVTLGRHIYREVGKKCFYDPYNENDLCWQYETALDPKDKFFKDKIRDNILNKNSIEDAQKLISEINSDGTKFGEQEIILISPGETILAHTNEFIGGLNNITTMMKAKSSMGRSFIEVCKCAGWGDVGYINRWTMEITNNSKSHTVILRVGMPIAQIVFLRTGQISKDSSYENKGNYQKSSNVQDLINEWSPKEMLPKLYLKKNLHFLDENL